MKYNFDKVIERHGTCSSKWDGVGNRFPKNPNAFPMWVADMDFQCPQEVVDAVVERAKHPIYGYVTCDDEFGKLAADWVLKRHGWKAAPQWVTFCGGVVPSLSVMVNAITNPGDKVIIQTPVYYPFTEVITNNGRFVLENPLKYDGVRYIMDYEDLAKKAADPKAKMMILCNPHNPVSRVFSKEELIKLGEICLKNNIIVVADEIHSDIVFRKHKHFPFSSICKEFADIAMTAIAPSKTFNLAGMQASAIIIPNPKLFSEYDMQIKRNRTQNISVFGLTAYTAAYKYGEDYLEQLIDYIWDNYLFLDDYLKKNTPKITVQEPEGTYLMWLDCSKLGLDAEEQDDFFINKAQVAMDNGIWFGEAGASYMRMNIACPRVLLAEGLRRIKKAYIEAGF